MSFIGILNEIRIHLVFSNNFGFKKKQELKSLLMKNGGIYSATLNKTCNILAVSDEETAKFSSNCRNALKLKIPIVSFNYIFDCIDQNKLLPFSKYEIIPSIEAQMFTKGIIKSRQNSTKFSGSSLKIFKPENPDLPYKEIKDNKYVLIDFAVFIDNNNQFSNQYHIIELHVYQIPNNRNYNNNIINLVSENTKSFNFIFKIIHESGSNNGKRWTNIKKELRFSQNSDQILNIYSKLITNYKSNNNLLFSDHLPHLEAGSNQLKQVFSEKLIKSLNKEVEGLVERIWNDCLGSLEQFIDGDIYKIKVYQIEKAEKLLAEMKALQIQNEKDKYESFKKLTKDFYSTLSHKEEDFEIILKNQNWISEKIYLCQLLKDLVFLSEANFFMHPSSTHAKYFSLRCHIEKMEGEKFEKMKIFFYKACNGCEKNLYDDNYEEKKDDEKKEKNNIKKITIENIYKVNRSEEVLIFNNKNENNNDNNKNNNNSNNNKFLFHGTKPDNVAGILSRGFLLPKSLKEDLGVQLEEKKGLGPGIYFASNPRTCLSYSKPSPSTSSHLIFCNEVFLGNIQKINSFSPQLTGPGKGFDSVASVPKSLDPNSYFDKEEFVIYSTDQQKLSCIFEVKVEGEEEKMINKIDFRVIQNGGQNEEYFIKVDEFSSKTEKLLSLEDPAKKTKSGLMTSLNEISFPLKSVDVSVKIIDMVAEVEILQQFKNDPSSKTLLNKAFIGKPKSSPEVKYILPLGPMATVCGFEAIVDNKKIIGVVKEKEEAKKKYKEAVEKEHGAYLMQEDEQVKDLFIITIGNLPLEANVFVKVKYITELTVEDQNIHFNLPPSVAPWLEGLVREWEEEESLMERGGLSYYGNQQNPMETSVEASIEMPFIIKNISSSTHNFKIKKTDQKAVIRTARNSDLSKGFDLTISLSEVHVPRMWVEFLQGNPESQVAMVTFYPEFEWKELLKEEIIFILDFSSSFFISKDIYQAIEVFFSAFQLLEPNQLFNVILFGSESLSLHVSSKPKTTESLQEILNFLKNNNGSLGQTNILPSLSKFFFLTSTISTRNILLFTDGYIDKKNDVISLLSIYSENNRIFTFGFGDSCDKHTLLLISRLTSGYFEFFDSNFKSKWQNKIKSQLEKCKQPCLSDVQVVWHNYNINNAKFLQAPSKINMLFNGNRIVVYGFVSDCNMVTLKAKINGKDVNTVVYTSPLNVSEGQILHRLATKALISDWTDGFLTEDKITDQVIKNLRKKDIINMSIKHSIVTKFTSFIAVEERKEGHKHLNSERKKLIEEISQDVLPTLPWKSQNCKVNLKNSQGLVSYLEVDSAISLKQFEIILKKSLLNVSFFMSLKTLKTNFDFDENEEIWSFFGGYNEELFYITSSTSDQNFRKNLNESFENNKKDLEKNFDDNSVLKIFNKIKSLTCKSEEDSIKNEELEELLSSEEERFSSEEEYFENNYELKEISHKESNFKNLFISNMLEDKNKKQSLIKEGNEYQNLKKNICAYSRCKVSSQQNFHLSPSSIVKTPSPNIINPTNFPKSLYMKIGASEIEDFGACRNYSNQKKFMKISPIAMAVDLKQNCLEKKKERLAVLKPKKMMPFNQNQAYQETKEKDREKKISWLFNFVKQDSNEGYFYWSLDDELEKCLGFNKLLLLQEISSNFLVVYGPDSLIDLNNLAATLLVGRYFKKDLFEDRFRNFLNNLNFSLPNENIDLNQVKNLMIIAGIYYFLLKMLSFYPDFIDKMENYFSKIEFD